jgi:hypothetical protein
MLKRLLVLVAVLVCVSSVYAAPTDTAAINLTIEQWVSVDFAGGSPSFDISIASGATSGNDTVAYTATGNCDAAIGCVVTTVPKDGSSNDAPGTWGASVDVAAHVAGATTNGTATVEVTALSGTETAESYTGGVATITITAS